MIFAHYKLKNRCHIIKLETEGIKAVTTVSYPGPCGVYLLSEKLNETKKSSLFYIHDSRIIIINPFPRTRKSPHKAKFQSFFFKRAFTELSIFEKSSTKNQLKQFFLVFFPSVETMNSFSSNHKSSILPIIFQESFFGVTAVEKTQFCFFLLFYARKDFPISHHELEYPTC